MTQVAQVLVLCRAADLILCVLVSIAGGRHLPLPRRSELVWTSHRDHNAYSREESIPSSMPTVSTYYTLEPVTDDVLLGIKINLVSCAC
jgi:hypothetical protein